MWTPHCLSCSLCLCLCLCHRMKDCYRLYLLGVHFKVWWDVVLITDIGSMSSIMILFSFILTVWSDSIRFDSIRFDSVWYVMKLLGQICLDCFDCLAQYAWYWYCLNETRLLMLSIHSYLCHRRNMWYFLWVSYLLPSTISQSLFFIVEWYITILDW